jgi:hypothetical protein
MLGLVVVMMILGLRGAIVLTVIKTEQRLVLVILKLLLEVSVLHLRLYNIKLVVLGVIGLSMELVRRLVVVERKLEAELVFVEQRPMLLLIVIKREQKGKQNMK